MIKSQDDLNQPETNSIEVLIEAISKLETTTKELEKVKEERDTYYKALMQIQYKTTALGGGIADMETALCQIDSICDCALRPDEMEEMGNEFKEIKELEK